MTRVIFHSIEKKLISVLLIEKIIETINNKIGEYCVKFKTFTEITGTSKKFCFPENVRSLTQNPSTTSHWEI